LATPRTDIPFHQILYDISDFIFSSSESSETVRIASGAPFAAIILSFVHFQKDGSS
jgi:hypothetical protein